jgi:hypothetical protein
MAQRRSPLATIEGLQVEEYPVPLRVGSPGWIDWLERNNRFRFECDFDAKFTAYKSNKGYWTAQRRYNGKLRHEYLGDSRHLTWEKLEQTAKKLNMGDSAYWNDKYPSPILNGQSDRRSLSLIEPKYETVSSDSLRGGEETVINQSLSELIQERDDYRDTVDALLGDCERYQKRIKELEARFTVEKRDRVLAALGVGKQSHLYQRIKELLDQMLD